MILYLVRSILTFHAGDSLKRPEAECFEDEAVL